MPFHTPAIALRTGDTPAAERARFQRDAGRHPDHHARVAVPAADVERARAPAVGRDGDHRRDPRAGLDQARRAPGAVARAARAHRRQAAAAHRPVGDAAAARRSRAVPGWRRHDAVDGARQAAKTPKRRQGRAPKPDFAASVHDEFDDDHSASSTAPVTIVDASEPKQLVDQRAGAGRGHGGDGASRSSSRAGPASQGPVAQSIWSSIHPRLLELIRAHRSTLLFVNSRRLAERLAGALNELAGEPLVRAHHGSLARAQRTEIEDLLKAGHLRALVATSSLELGIDMGAIDLVVQIEAPPSVASGLQRIGRAGHSVGAGQRRHHLPEVPRRPRGLRGGDARRCARARSNRRAIRATRSTCSRSRSSRWRRWSAGRSTISSHGAIARRRSPSCSRRVFDGVLDMLSGRYPSDEFAELRPRVTWDRVNGIVMARQGAKRVAIANAGTIPDRGLYGVFLAGAEQGQGARRRARRRDGVRGARRRDVPARRLDLAHRADHARPRAGLARARRAGQDAVLEGRRPGPAGRARPGDRQAGARAAQGRPPRRRSRTLEQRSRPRRAGRREPAAVSRRAASRRRRRARRSHHRHRALARRARRLARRACCRRSAAASTRRGRWRRPRASATKPASTSR